MKVDKHNDWMPPREPDAYSVVALDCGKLAVIEYIIPDTWRIHWMQYDGDEGVGFEVRDFWMNNALIEGTVLETEVPTLSEAKAIFDMFKILRA